MTDSQDHVNLFYLKLGSETQVCFVMKSLPIYISVFVILYSIYLCFCSGLKFQCVIDNFSLLAVACYVLKQYARCITLTATFHCYLNNGNAIYRTYQQSRVQALQETKSPLFYKYFLPWIGTLRNIACSTARKRISEVSSCSQGSPGLLQVIVLVPYRVKPFSVRNVWTLYNKLV